MVVIVNYCSDEGKAIGSFLNELSINNVISLRESDICKANHIIFPPAADVQAVIRKLHILNLTSLLRMIKKPVLGIGSGVELMLEYSLHSKESCLSYFPIEGEKNKYCEELQFEKGLSPVNFEKPSKLFTGIKSGELFYFDFLLSMPIEHALSTASTSIPQKVCASLEKNNFYGVFFNPVKSGEQGKEILKNFCSII